MEKSSASETTPERSPSIARVILVNAGILALSTVLTIVVLLLWNEGANNNFVPFRYMFF